MRVSVLTYCIFKCTFKYLALISVFTLPRLASAVDLYPKDGALTTYSDEIELLEQEEYDYSKLPIFELPKEEEKLEEKKEELAPKVEILNQQREEQKNQVKEPTKEKLTTEEIKTKFGDPTEAFPVVPVTDAPLPFQGMQAALNANQPELAEQYAEQFLMYVNKVNSNTQQVQDIFKRVLGKNQLLPGQDKTQNQAPPKDEEAFDEEEARREVRKAIDGQVPVDPFGQVDVYYFFSLKDENSNMMLSEVDSLYKSISQNKNVKFHALLIDENTQSEISEYKVKNKINYPVESALDLKKELKIETVPSTMLVTRNSKKIVMEEGYRRFFYLDELVKAMQGRLSKA